MASTLLKQTIILTRIDNPAAAQHVREMLIDSKHKLLTLKGNIDELNTWVCTHMDMLRSLEQEAVDLLHLLWKAYKSAPDEAFIMYIKDMKFQSEDRRAMYTAEELMV